MSKVIFVKKEDIHKFSEALKIELKDFFPKNGIIAVKLHMGEATNKNYVSPDIVKKVVDVLKDLGVKPFLFDSTTRYPSKRYTVEDYIKTARANGFSKETMGCDVVISNESGADVKTKNLTVKVCKPLAHAHDILVLSHVKGHPNCGIGGAIKNLGMGGVCRKTKADVHSISQPVFKGECKLCGTCVEVCRNKAVSLGKEKAEFDYDACGGCGKCIVYCPYKALKPKKEMFDELLAEAAEAVVRNKKVYYVNVLLKIAKLCDCFKGDAGGIVCPDIGILLGTDPVAIDKASVDLIDKTMKQEDFFKSIHKKSPLLQIKAAESLGMGSQEYSLNLK
jgi:uncharacterized Fe-S center protein